MAYVQIVLNGPDAIIEEAPASGTISPGHLIEEQVDGAVEVHAHAGEACLPLIALEQIVDGKGVDTDYVSGDTVRYAVARRGEEYALILTTYQDAVVGSDLESNGDGTVRVAGMDSSWGAVKIQSIVGKAREAVTTADEVGYVRTRIW